MYRFADAPKLHRLQPEEVTLISCFCYNTASFSFRMATAGEYIKEHDRVGLVQIFVSFMKIGAVLFGGGYAMLPLLEREVVEQRRWCRIEEMGDYYAMAQLVPGVVAVNTAMLIGHRLRGFWGTLAAMLGVVLVPFFVLLAYAIAFDSMSELAVLRDGMAGLRPAVAGLMVGVAWKMFNRNRQTALGLSVALGTAFMAVVLDVPAMYLILGGVLAGILWFFAQYAGILKKTSGRLD